MTTRLLDLRLKCEFCQLFISNKIFPNKFVDVDCLNSRLCCSVKVLYSFDVRWFSNAVSGVNAVGVAFARSDSGSGFPYILKSYNLYRWKWSNLHNWFHKNISPSRRSSWEGTCPTNAPKVLNEGVLDVTDQEVPSPHGPSSLGSLIDTGRPHRYWKEIKIKFTTNDMSNWAQKLEERLCICSVLWLIPYFGFFHGVVG